GNNLRVIPPQNLIRKTGNRRFHAHDSTLPAGATQQKPAAHFITRARPTNPYPARIYVIGAHAYALERNPP
ncbi:MAG TPA: hypothetical protein VIH56_09750, partial [Candidatus Acidoferrales bacterium]